MMQLIFSHSKTTRIIVITILFILVVICLFVSDSFINKIHVPKVSSSCILCPLKINKTSNNTAELSRFRIFLPGIQHTPLDILFLFVHAKNNPSLKEKFNRCISSLFDYASAPLHLHVLTDRPSLETAVRILKETASLARVYVQISFYDVDLLMKPLQELINTLRPHFSFKQGAYYSDGLFYISIGLFRVTSLRKIILVDADVKFLDDVKALHDYFDIFSPEALIGIAREQQPVYRHILHEYRRIHNNTRIGDPPPDGITGFNSGVLLLNLERMKVSPLYVDIIDNSSIILNLIYKYKFKGHLGDQDFYTLLSFEYPSLFHILPCTWNRQLCQWWKHHGYKNVFDLYYSCVGKVHLLHGNCNSFIPIS